MNDDTFSPPYPVYFVTGGGANLVTVLVLTGDPPAPEPAVPLFSSDEDARKFAVQHQPNGIRIQAHLGTVQNATKLHGLLNDVGRSGLKYVVLNPMDVKPGDPYRMWTTESAIQDLQQSLMIPNN
jgi:hypothetical protein